jgi:hypothetical protein
MALLACLCHYGHLFNGLTNRSLRELIAGYSTNQATYDLRRVRRKGLIHRIPHSQRYELTDEGRRIAVFFTKTYTRIVNPSLAELDPSSPTRSLAARRSAAPGATSNTTQRPNSAGRYRSLKTRPDREDFNDQAELDLTAAADGAGLVELRQPAVAVALHD